MKVWQYIILSLSIVCHVSAMQAQDSYSQKLQVLGYSDKSKNLSDSLKLKLDQPALAYVNLTSKYGIPYTKTSNFKDWIEYYDPATDTYFKKKVLVNVQGQTSTSFPKRNVAMDFCEDAWLCDTVPTITFKGWVKQDAFHLKAFYTDWLRGIGIVGYQLYDEMDQQMPEEATRIWKRAGVEGNDKARCYPDGFPCAMYLNGEYYGIYVWQLKKHRRNMAMEKDCETHIHLDGNMGEDNFWNGTIKWSSFEVRNPKDLTDIEGNPYNGDSPKELAEGAVKETIVALSQRCNELKTLSRQGASDETIRAAIAEHFDVESMVNYLAFSTVVSNYDGFTKNWQWLTYDGKKWYVAPYDLDCTFGNFHLGTFVFPAEFSYVDSDHRLTLSRRGIATWFWDYYFDEISARYVSLREAGVFDASHISEMIHTWHDRIGTEQYEVEWPLWPKSMCVRPTITNEGWEECNDWNNYYHLPEWKAEKTFSAGDLCRLDNRVWLASQTTQGVKPYVQMGYQDSLERFDAWISRRIELDDEYFGYQPEDIRAIEMSCMEHSAEQAIFTLEGRRTNQINKGINLIRNNKGESKIIFIK